MTPQWKIQSEWTETHKDIISFKFRLKLEDKATYRQNDESMNLFIKDTCSLFEKPSDDRWQLEYNGLHQIFEVSFNDETDALLFKLKYT